MKLKNKIAFKKIIAGFFLLVFLFVLTTQLFHTHTSHRVLYAGKKINLHTAGTTQCYPTNLNSRCFICEYQLSKDADASAGLQINYAASFIVANGLRYCYTPFTITATFTNRGPPSCTT